MGANNLKPETLSCSRAKLQSWQGMRFLHLCLHRLLLHFEAEVLQLLRDHLFAACVIKE